MISVNKNSSAKPTKNVFKYTFLSIFGMLLLSIIIYYNTVADESNDIKTQNDVESQIDKVIALPINNAYNVLLYGQSLHMNISWISSHIKMQPGKETETTKEENIATEQETVTEELEALRQNKLYCVIEDDFTSTPDIEYLDYLWEMCIKYDVKEYYELFIAQMYHESTFRPNLISGTNDYGLMQINTCNHDWLKEKFGFTDFLDPYVSIESGVYIMSGYLRKYNDVQKALVCYNRGESAVINGTYSTDYSTGVLYDMTLLVEIKEGKE